MAAEDASFMRAGKEEETHLHAVQISYMRLLASLSTEGWLQNVPRLLETCLTTG